MARGVQPQCLHNAQLTSMLTEADAWIYLGVCYEGRRNTAQHPRHHERMLLTWPSSASLCFPSTLLRFCTSQAHGEMTLSALEMFLPPPASVASQNYLLAFSPLPHPGIQPGVFLAQLCTWFSSSFPPIAIAFLPPVDLLDPCAQLQPIATVLLCYACWKGGCNNRFNFFRSSFSLLPLTSKDSVLT